MDLNFLILGAGPSGLTFAHKLKELGENSFVLLEKEADAGGLCRSRTVDGSALDIGGGHFLDLKRKHVLNFLFQFLPEQNWNRFERKTTIMLHNREVDYPLESNIFQLSNEDQVEYLHAIALSGEQQGKPKPVSFQDWVQWKFGSRIAEDYMIPYNKKIWSIELERLGTHWLDKLPSVNFKEMLRSCLTKKPEGQIPAHASFLYPKQGGYGQIWKIMADQLGEKIQYLQELDRIDIPTMTVRTRSKEYKAKHIISSIPWPTWLHVAQLPEDVKSQMKRLEYTSLEVGYYKENLKSDSQWIYIPDENVPHHRILNRRTFVTGSRGYWTETNTKRTSMQREQPEWNHLNEFAYPVNTQDKPAAIREVLEWGRQNHIYGLGRWGTWEHVNSDVVVDQALNLAMELRGEQK